MSIFEKILESCPVIEPQLNELCNSNSSGPNAESCKNIKVYVFLSNADCYISKVFYPLTVLFIIIGTVLNLYSLYCFTKINKRNSQNIYLSILSLVDTINLHINFALPMLRKIDPIDEGFRRLNLVCRLTGVFTEFFLIFPTWIVVLLTFERLIFIVRPSKRRSSYTQLRAKISILFLAIVVLSLCLYRLKDLKGIDQLSVFSILACDTDDESSEKNGKRQLYDKLRYMNLIIWTILPEFLTLIMSLIIIYRIKLVARRMQSDHSRACQTKYNQATRIVLLISILFLIFQTPTGIMITLDFIYGKNKRTTGIIMILVSNKLTMILYEINLSCKFFIYKQTFRNFKGILCTSFFQFTRRPNSAKLGRPVLENVHHCSNHQKVHFSSYKQSITSRASQSDSYSKSAEEYHYILNNRHPRTNSTNISKLNREQKPLNVVMTKANAEAHISLSRRADLSGRYERK
ncbi:unnamed protein product [Adineta steineri]|uniref:G-protein coupled receptors family 1 profile domain-containing protein n=1 Tax=Adineta steineri TaxID=433720 RepID=A0A815U8P4_9BILA|nr:unnamed protein product [Adineta steineri]CAF1512907.1 unnamed protein product [Adineta steineri]